MHSPEIDCGIGDGASRFLAGTARGFKDLNLVHEQIRVARVGNQSDEARVRRRHIRDKRVVGVVARRRRAAACGVMRDDVAERGILRAVDARVRVDAGRPVDTSGSRRGMPGDSADGYRPAEIYRDCDGANVRPANSALLRPHGSRLRDDAVS